MRPRAAAAFEAKKPLQIIELGFEDAKASEVLVEIMATGVCRTDAYTLDTLDTPECSECKSCLMSNCNLRTAIRATRGQKLMPNGTPLKVLIPS